MNNQEMLNLAVMIAVEAHFNQYDKGYKPYILHPLRIMGKLLFDTELACIGVLHDVVEDSETTIEDLIAFDFSTRVTDALTLLTHRKEDSYEEYIEGVCTSYDAIRVKRKNIEDNCDV